jgi:hypothetical protein
MYFNTTQYRLLTIEENFANLQSINSDNSFDFKFTYKISQNDAIKYNVNAVEITVYTSTVNKRLLFGSDDSIEAKTLIDNLLSDTLFAKTASKAKESFILAKRKSDLTAFIDNEAIFRIKNGIEKQSYRSKLKTVSSQQLIQSNEVKPILHVSNNRIENVYYTMSSSIQQNIKYLNYDLIIRRGIDPQQILNLHSNVIDSRQSFQGTLKIGEKDSDLQNLVNYYTIPNLESIQEIPKTNFDLSEQGIDVIIDDVSDVLKIDADITFKLQKNQISDVFVKFDLLNVDGVVIDSVVKTLEILTHIKLFQIPLVPPIVKCVQTNLKTNLQITQQDGNEIFIYKKTLYSSVNDIEDYSFVGTYLLNKGQTITVSVDTPYKSTTLYRVISGYSGVRSSHYTNSVVTKFGMLKNFVSLIAINSYNGVLIEIRKIPLDVISIQILQKNLTHNDSTFTSIGIVHINDNIRNSDLISFTDSNVQNYNVYEYNVILYHKNGITEYSSSNQIIEYIRATPNLIDLSVDNLKIDHSNQQPNVTFDVKMQIIDTSIDVIKSLLQKSGITEYDLEIVTKRDQLKSLLSFSLQRINLTTGETENFGACSKFNFNDKEMRKNFAVKPLQYENQYKYVLTALVRTAESLLLTNKSVIDKNKKQYTYNPSKFLHPITLRDGLILSPNEHVKSELEYGTIGVTTTVNVNFDNESCRISNANAIVYDKFVQITWRIDGKNKIDHYVIMKEIGKIRSIVGFAHNIQENNMWHDYKKTRGDSRYIITPVYLDYSLGESITTNSILIDD